LFALDKDTHRALAAQFIDRSIQKRYVGEWVMLSIFVFSQQALLIRRCASLKPYLTENRLIREAGQAQLAYLYFLTTSTDQCKWFMKKANKQSPIIKLSMLRTILQEFIFIQ